MQTDMPPLIYVLAFVAVVLFVQAMMSFVFTSRDQTRQVNRRLSMLASGLGTTAVYAALTRASVHGAMAKVPFGFAFQKLEIYLRQADLPMPAPRFAAMVGAGAAVMWIFSVLVVGTSLMPSLLSLFFSCAISVLAAQIWLGWRRSRKRKQLEEQLPTALDIINRGLRAGHPFVAAIRLAADEMGDPIGSELGLVVDDATYGLELKDALTNFAKRTRSADAQFMAVSVSIQAQTGGNLAEILDNLAKVIRGRVSLGKRVHALSSEGRTSAMILSALPLFLIGFIGLLHPNYYTSKFSDPVFWPVVAGVCVLYGIGRIMIYRITHFKY